VDRELQNLVPKGAVLLEVMIDTLVDIFKMAVEAVRFILRPKKEDSMRIVGPNSKVRDYIEQIGLKLKTAKNQLIVEADGQAHNERVGPVVTPETLMIILMERLIRGVYGERSVDIIGLYEECLQNLVIFPFASSAKMSQLTNRSDS